MAAPDPHHYEVVLERKASTGDGSPIMVTAADARIARAGNGSGTWSAEELLLSATSLSLLTSFQELAGRERLPIGMYRCVTEGVLDHGGFIRIVLRVDLGVAASDVERAERILQAAKRDCLLARSLGVPLELESSVKAA